MKITVGGLAGTGTSTTSRMLADRLGYQFQSVGGILRQKAVDRGMTIHELDEYAKPHPEVDLELDKEIESFGKDHDNIVVEGRLAWRFIPDSIKIYLECEYQTRVERVASRENKTFEEAEAETKIREEAIAIRYKNVYGIENLGDPSHYDLVIDTTDLSIEEVLAEITEYFNISK